MRIQKTISIVITSFALAVAAPVVLAADGDKELQISMGAFKSVGADSGSVTGEVTYGKYVSPNWLLGVIQGLNYSFIENADDVWTASTVGFANYHFKDGDSKSGDFVPFAGVFLGGSYNDNDATGTLGPNLGFKYYVNDSTFLTTRYRYEWFFDDIELGSPSDFKDSLQTVSDNRSDGNNVLTVGLGFTF